MIPILITTLVVSPIVGAICWSCGYVSGALDGWSDGHDAGWKQAAGAELDAYDVEGL